MMADSKFFVLIGCFFFLLSLVVFTGFPKVYEKLMYQEISLTNNSLAYGVWKDITNPTYERVYFFNITNAEDFLEHKAELNVSQVGPYTYKSRWTKVNIRWHFNGTVSYKERKTYHFVAEESSGNEYDEIYTFNAPFAIASNYLNGEGFYDKETADAVFRKYQEDIVIKRSVGELIFSGYHDPIVRYDWDRHKHRGYPFENGTFAWFYGKNGSDDGRFTVHTGENDIRHLNEIDNWNGKRLLSYWFDTSCNMINGTNGEMTHPLRDRHKTYNMFWSPLCRSVTFTYSHDVNHFGIPTRRYIATDSWFGNVTVYPENECFVGDVNLAPGVQNVSSCYYGAPYVISHPHFLMADPSYGSSVSGLEPSWSQHQSYLDVEPRTGLSFDITLRLQMNLRMNRIPFVYKFSRVPEGVFPVYWSEVHLEITKDFADFFKSTVETPKSIAYSVGGAAMMLAGMLFIVGAFLACKVRISRTRDNEPLLNKLNSGSYCTDHTDKKAKSWDSYFSSKKRPYFIFYSYNDNRRKAKMLDSLNVNEGGDSTDDELLFSRVQNFP